MRYGLALRSQTCRYHDEHLPPSLPVYPRPLGNAAYLPAVVDRYVLARDAYLLSAHLPLGRRPRNHQNRFPSDLLRRHHASLHTHHLARYQTGCSGFRACRSGRVSVLPNAATFPSIFSLHRGSQGMAYTHQKSSRCLSPNLFGFPSTSRHP